jgi:hypothetical protein
MLDAGAGPLDPHNELITLKQAAAELPRRRAGKKTHVATVYRWTDPGCRGVKLRYVQVGATRCTTRAWLAEFFDELTRRAASSPPAIDIRTPTARRRAVTDANAELSRLRVP